MPNSYIYNPNPPRVWSRVQRICTDDINSSTTVYDPLTNTFVPQSQANAQLQMLYKGNILQYKKNSSSLTKNQKYAQISKGLWSNRKKSFATQSVTYSNPNTTGMERINYTEIPFPNQIVGQPNNISGPFQYNVQNPYLCSSDVLQDGGTLVCNAFVDPCSGEIIQTVSQQQCFPTYCSDVPGPVMDLCWNPSLSTFYPRQNYTMNNSVSKWPQGYKGFVSAVTPTAPVLLSAINNSNNVTNVNYVTLTWSVDSSVCIPISQFNIYINNSLVKTVSYQYTSTDIYNLQNCTKNSFYVTSVSNTIESLPSNSIDLNIYILLAPTITKVTSDCTTATLSWTNSVFCANVQNYYIYQDNVLIQTLPPNTFTTTITNLITCLNYLFYITYLDGNTNKESPPSNVAVVTQTPCVATSPLATPSNQTITITWSSPVSSCTPISYNIFYSNGILVASGATSPYVLSGLINGQTYSFFIVTYSSLNNTYSPNTNIFSATLTIPLPPTNLTGLPGNTAISLNWLQSVSSNISYYNIYYQDITTPGPINVVQSPYPSTSYNLIGLTNTITYNVYMTSVNNIGIESILTSNLISITLPSPPNFLNGNFILPLQPNNTFLLLVTCSPNSTIVNNLSLTNWVINMNSGGSTTTAVVICNGNISVDTQLNPSPLPSGITQYIGFLGDCTGALQTGFISVAQTLIFATTGNYTLSFYLAPSNPLNIYSPYITLNNTINISCSGGVLNNNISLATTWVWTLYSFPITITSIGPYTFTLSQNMQAPYPTSPYISSVFFATDFNIS